MYASALLLFSWYINNSAKTRKNLTGYSPMFSKLENLIKNTLLVLFF